MDDCSEELNHPVPRQVQLPGLVQEVHYLPSLFDDGVYVGNPLLSTLISNF